MLAVLAPLPNRATSRQASASACARSPWDPPTRGLTTLAFARNRVVHDWANAVKGRDATNPVGLTVQRAGQSRSVGPPTIWEWFWHDRASLPSGTNNRGGPAYDPLLADKPVRQALDQLRAKF